MDEVENDPPRSLEPDDVVRIPERLEVVAPGPHLDEESSDAGSVHPHTGGAEERDGEEPIAPSIQRLRDLHQDTLELVNNNWLALPADKLDPLLECAVTVNAQCLLQSNVRPSGAEFVWVGLGLAMPDNLQKVAWCMEQLLRWGVRQVKKYGNYTGALVSTGETRLVLNATSAAKKPPISGLMAEFDRASLHYECKDTDFPDGEEGPSFMEMCMEDMAGRSNKEYHKVDVVDMEWGLIPIQYKNLKGDTVRDIVHVLRVVPAKGFDLLRFLELRVFGQVHQKAACAHVDVKQVVEHLTVAMNYEIASLGKTALFRDCPHPWSVINTVSALSPLNVLSPFAVFFKIRRLIGAYTPGTLIIDGFPPLRNRGEMDLAIAHFRALNQGYLAAMELWRSDFCKAVDSDKMPNEANKAHLTKVLSWANKCLDRLNCRLNLKVNLQNGIYELKGYKDMMRLRLPDLAMAEVTFFTFVEGNAIFNNMEKVPFIAAHIVNRLEPVTPSYLYEKYQGSKENLTDFPYAGMFAHSWHAHELTMKGLVESGKDLEARALATKRYLTVQLTILSRSLLMDLFMSDRVLEQARVLQRLSEDNTVCAKIDASCDFFTHSAPLQMQQLEQTLLFDEMQMVDYTIAAAWCHFNRYARMNTLNLSGARSIVTSDILTFLGIHHKTWVWMGYTNLFTGGGGHMRALTEDSHGRVPAVYLIKANSAGYTNVIIAGVNNLQSMLVYVSVGLRDEVIRLFQILKMDRGTRSAMEGLCAVECVEGKVITYPERQTFLCQFMLDEFFRNLDREGIKAAVTLLPRDCSAGTGCTFKKIEDPDRKQGMVNGKVQQMRGLCPNIVAIAGNSQAPDPTFAEASKSLLCAFNANCPGAQPVDEFYSAEATKKRSRSMYQLNDSNGSSAHPEDPVVCAHLAHVLAVVPMATKQQLGLTNKTGLVAFEICRVHKAILDWFLGFFKRMFKDCLGSTLLMSFDRLTGIQVTRAVASCVNSTMLLHLRRPGNTYTHACIDALADCMSSGLTVAKCGAAMREAVGKTICTNLLMVNGIIGRLLHTPTVDLDFLCSCLDPRRRVDVTCEDFRLLRDFLQGLCDRRSGQVVPDVELPNGRTGELLGSYVAVPDLPTASMYAKHEAYLEEYLSVVKGSGYTYFEALKECTARSVDMAYLLDIDDAAVKLSSLCDRLGVRYEREWDHNPNSDDRKCINFLFPIYHQAEGKGEGPMSRCLVNVVMHLVVSALVGPNPLHSDNRDSFALSLFTFLAQRHMPAQCTPTRRVVMDSFDMDGAIKPQVASLLSWGHPDYFQRCVADKMAWENRDLSELKVDYWNYAAEDVVHIGPYLHTLQQLHAGRALTAGVPLEPIPHLSHRSAELVVGRVYPLHYTDDVTGEPGLGTLCIAPEGQGFVMVKARDQRLAVDFEHWPTVVYGDLRCTVGALVHRANAVVDLGEDGLGLIVPQSGSAFEGENFEEYDRWSPEKATRVFITDERHYMNSRGNYKVVAGDQDEDVHVPNANWVHRSLLRLGTHVIVQLEGRPTRRMPNNAPPRIRGWVRYPDETEAGDDRLVYFCVRVKRTSAQRQFQVELLSAPPGNVRLWVDDSPEEVAEYLTPEPPAPAARRRA